MHKKDLNGFCPSKGDTVQFTVGTSEKGSWALDWFSTQVVVLQYLQNIHGLRSIEVV